MSDDPNKPDAGRELADRQSRAPAQPAKAPAALTKDDLIDRTRMVEEIVRDLMEEDVHYSKLPGTSTIMLEKTGSEQLLMAFQIAVNTRVEERPQMDHGGSDIGYRVYCDGYHGSGQYVGTGIGECSSRESKYRWEVALNEQHWNDTPADQRRQHWKKGKKDFQTGKRGADYKELQVRRDPADVSNTVLKMAKARALRDLVNTSLGAGAVFRRMTNTQDAAWKQKKGNNRGRPQRPQGATANQNSRQSPQHSRQPDFQAPGAGTPQGQGQNTAQQEQGARPVGQMMLGGTQLSILGKRIADAGLEEADVANAFSVRSLEELPFEAFNDVANYVAQQAKTAKPEGAQS